jgi:four helix bundle protein
MARLNSFRELRVYQELRRLHLLAHEASLQFPKFELYELGSQLRRSSNAAPAILAEGWGSCHTNIYLEAINRSKGEIRETQHHLDMAHAKQYLDQPRWADFDAAYEACDKMRARLHERLGEWRGTTRTGYEVRENSTQPYTSKHADEWAALAKLTADVMDEFAATRHPPPSTVYCPPATFHPPPSTIHP